MNKFKTLKILIKAKDQHLNTQIKCIYNNMSIDIQKEGKTRHNIKNQQEKLSNTPKIKVHRH